MKENLGSYAKHHKFIMGALVILVILGTAVGSRILGRKQSQVQSDALAKVALVTAKDFMKNQASISANGVVESLQQAEIRSQASAPVTKIYAQIGQQVSPGQILVTLQNNDIAAQLTQVQALLKSQQARLDEMRKGARSEDLRLTEAQVNAAKQTLEDTKNQQDTMLSNALSNLLNSGLTAVPGIGNTGSANPVISGSYTSTEQGQYAITLYATGEGLKFQTTGLESAEGNVYTTPVPLGKRGLYIQFPSTNMPTNNTWVISIPNTQAPSYTAANSAYLSAKQAHDAAINAATNALVAAQRGYDLKLAGASSDQIKAQEALVEQAQGQVQTISAQLEKTVIRSPIKGTVSSLSLKYGELVSPGQLVAAVVNKGGLQVKAYISDYDLPFAAEGAEVRINDTASGTLVRLSPSVDPRSKNVEVDVAVNDPENFGLVVGQNASIKIAARQSSGNEPVFLVPLQAVKVADKGAFIYTVSQDSVVEEHPVALGSVSGEFVEVKSGLTPEMKIVSTVYELKAGQKVIAE